MAGAHFTKRRDPRDLAEPRLSRRRRLGHGRRGAHLFRRLGPPPDAVAGGGAWPGCRARPRASIRASTRQPPRPGRARCWPRWCETGAITATQAQQAAAQIAFPPHRPSRAGWFADWAAGQAEPLLPPDADATLRTTLDPRLQAVAETRLTALLAGPGAAHGASQGAVVVLDAASGAVRAMVGGRDYRDSPYNRAVLARRQPGSAFKPFVWLAALENGHAAGRHGAGRADPASATGARTNFERRYLGEITVEEALAQSINTAAVRLLLQCGRPARRGAAAPSGCGIADRLPDNASLALGTGEVGLLELAAAYAPFFNGGERVTPFGVAARSPRGAHRRGADHAAGAGDRSRPGRDDGAHAGRGGVARARARRRRCPGATVAGKTGTTQDSRDAWFIGWTDGEIIGVWLGNDDNAPMKDVHGRRPAGTAVPRHRGVRAIMARRGGRLAPTMRAGFTGSATRGR